MTTATELEVAQRIGQDLQKAHEKASREIQKLLPVGSRLTVDLGRSTVPLRVSGYGWSFSNPTEIQGCNENTGKIRKFDASYTNFRVRQLPTQQGGAQ
jgi:hypothetical protein